MIKHPFRFVIDYDMFDEYDENYVPDDDYDDEDPDGETDEEDIVYILHKNMWLVSVSDEGLARIPDLGHQYDVDGRGRLNIIGVDFI